MGLPCSSSLKTQQEETYRAWWLSGFPSILAAKSGELQESEDKTRQGSNIPVLKTELGV